MLIYIVKTELMNKEGDKSDFSKRFDAFFGSSAIWQPQPCKEQSTANPTVPTAKSSKPHRDESADAVRTANQMFPKPPRDEYADENANFNILRAAANQSRNEYADENAAKIVRTANQLFPPPEKKLAKPNVLFNIDAPPFLSSRSAKELFAESTLKRTRSGNGNGNVGLNQMGGGIETGELMMKTPVIEPENKIRRQSVSPKKLLPDNEDFEDAIIAAVLGT